MPKTVAVYGSSRVQPDQADYRAAVAVGKQLAQNGYTVMTGGYAGIMLAVSQGAAEAGGHVIGVTTEIFTNGRGDGITPNAFLHDEVRYPTLSERLAHLVQEADAYVCMPGGLGTLQELVTVWGLMSVGEIERRPLICYGAYWRQMLAPIEASPYTHSTDWQYLTVADTADDVILALQQQKVTRQ
jgi:uncharacterized protein (TIGR00730 family)